MTLGPEKGWMLLLGVMKWKSFYGLYSILSWMILHVRLCFFAFHGSLLGRYVGKLWRWELSLQLMWVWSSPVEDGGEGLLRRRRDDERGPRRQDWRAISPVWVHSLNVPSVLSVANKMSVRSGKEEKREEKKDAGREDTEWLMCWDSFITRSSWVFYLACRGGRSSGEW